MDVVFGVGIHVKLGDQGYVGLTRDHLINDVLGNRASYDDRQVIEGTLPHILCSPGYVPVHKYLRAVGALDATGKVMTSTNVSPKIEKMANKISGGMPASADIARKAPTVLADIHSVAELQAKHGLDGVLNYGTCMPEDKVDPAELRKFLNSTRHLRDDDNWRKTQYIKLVCFLDWLENGPARPTVSCAGKNASSTTGSSS